MAPSFTPRIRGVRYLRCQAINCEGNAAVLVRRVRLCQRHTLMFFEYLRDNGLDYHTFEGDVREVLFNLED